MNKEQLEQIIKQNDFLGIEKQLRENGFFNAKTNPNTNEASLVDIVHGKSTKLESIEKGKYLYVATIFEDVKGYEKYTWIWLEVLKAKKNYDKKKIKKPNFKEIFKGFENSIDEDDETVYFPDKIIIYAKERTEQ